VKDYYLLSQIN